MEQHPNKERARDGAGPGPPVRHTEATAANHTVPRRRATQPFGGPPAGSGAVLGFSTRH